MLLSRHLYLTGFRGTGKTSVAARLAAALATRPIDLDDVIEKDNGKSIRQIFSIEGETFFRDQETVALNRVSSETPAVISLGGGAILRAENRDVIAATGTCVWLDASAKEICARVLSDSTTAERRPALTKLSQQDEIETLLAERRPIYESSANHRIDTTGKSINEVAKEILKLGLV
jgi:shikimate kinase